MMTRRVGVLGCVVVLVLAVISPAFAGSIGNVRDDFNAIAYDGSDGSLGWGSDWLETPLANGPSVGEVRVVADSRCAAFNCLRLGPGNVTGQGVHREVDLTDATSATLTFVSRRQLDDGSGGRMHVAVSSDGWSWEPVVEYSLDSSDATGMARSVDLTPWAGTVVRIGFFGTGTLGGYFFLDNVNVGLSTNVKPSFATQLPPRADREGDAISFTASATDPEQDELTYTGSGLPPGISVDAGTGLIAGTIGYEAAADSPYSTVITVTDPEGATDLVSFSWTVVNRNRPPTLSVIGNRSAEESTPLAVAVDADDPDLPDDKLTYSLIDPPLGASINPDGLVEWTPSEADGPGQFTLTVGVEDSAGAMTTRSFEVEVAEVNLAPELEPIADMALRPGDNLSFLTDWYDPDLPKNTVTFIATGLPPGITIGSTSGRISGTIAEDADLSSGTVTITATDDGYPVARSIITFSWQIGTGNRPPVLAPIPEQALGESGLVEFVADADDADVGDSVSYWLAAGIDPLPDGASIDTATGEFSWEPTESQHDAVYRINVGVSDSGSPRLSDTQLVTIVVPAYNEPPGISTVADQETAEGEPVLFTVAASDENESDRLRFTATGLPEGLRINSATGAVSGTVGFEAAANSPYTVAVTVADDGVPVRTASTSFAWTITDTNRPPEVPSLEVVVLIGDEVAITLPATDPDGDPLDFAITDPPLLGLLEGEAPNLIYSAIGGPADGFTYVASDGEFSVAGAVSIDLRLSNDPPQAVLDEYQTAANVVLEVAAPGVLGNDSDPDTEPLSAELVAPPDHGELKLNSDGSFSYLPANGYEGTDKFTYSAIDGLGERSAATVVITVGNPAPDAVAPGVAPVTPSARSAIVAATGSAWEPAPPSSRSFFASLGHSVAAMLRGFMSSIAGVRYPLILLAALLLLALTFGGVSLVPAGEGKTQEEGLLEVFASGSGRLIPDSGGDEVFVHSGIFELSSTLTSGQRVEFIAATIRGRRIALKVWPAI